MLEFAWDIKTSFIVSCWKLQYVYICAITCKTNFQQTLQQLPEEILEVHEVFKESISIFFYTQQKCMGFLKLSYLVAS